MLLCMYVILKGRTHEQKPVAKATTTRKMSGVGRTATFIMGIINDCTNDERPFAKLVSAQQTSSGNLIPILSSFSLYPGDQARYPEQQATPKK